VGQRRPRSVTDPGNHHRFRFPLIPKALLAIEISSLLPQTNSKPRVVIIGAGFAGLAVARGLRKTKAQVTLIDRDNYHLFQPLLYQVATAALSPADIAEPIRRLVRGQDNCEVILGSVTGIDVTGRQVAVDCRSLRYDILVLAAGATHSYFGHDNWEKFAPGLKTLADARTIRARLLLCFERAERSENPQDRERLMTLVVVGGGPSGVELAGSIAELARHTLSKDFRHIDPKSARVILLEGGPHILGAFPLSLSRYAARMLAKLGVDVRENCAVKNITADTVDAGGAKIPAGLTIWAAGVKASPLASLLGVETDKHGHVLAGSDLAVIGLPDVFALGDIALVKDVKGKALPGLAQVAKQQGEYLGRALAAKIASGTTPKPFVFHDRGNVAIVGRHSAVVDFGWTRLTGITAWWLWAIVHIYLLAGLQHRVLVAIQWLWRYVTYDRGARLILQQTSDPNPSGKP
jgi:NADH dehydrogenase